MKSDTCENSVSKRKKCFSDRNYTLSDTAILESIALQNEFTIVEQKEFKRPKPCVTEGSFYNEIIKMQF